MKLKDLKLNEKNPRKIKPEKLEKLKQSLQKFEQMMEARPIVIDENNIILGGNMRFTALKALGYKEIPDNWVYKMSDLTEEQKKEFIIKDNVGFGEWDWELLANEWDSVELEDFGLDVPDYRIENNEVIDTDVDLEFAEELTIGQQFLIITFEDDNEYEEIKNALKLKQVVENNLEKKHLNNKGTERVIKYKDFIKKYDNSNSLV
jgi:GH15 family glucan-1,4-alpha-glucosidase